MARRRVTEEGCALSICTGRKEAVFNEEREGCDQEAEEEDKVMSVEEKVLSDGEKVEKGVCGQAKDRERGHDEGRSCIR